MSQKELQQRIAVPLQQLYLDPNNYRFIDLPQYVKVPDEKITDKQVQKRTFSFIIGEKNSGIEDLLKSFMTNGYLEVDQIQVEKIDEDKYRVLEGNRRVATLKKLFEDFENGYDIGILNPVIFDEVPVTLVTQQKQGEHEMIMALKHISGNKKWLTLNQAQLLHDLIYKYGWTEAQVVNSIGGITLHKLRRDLRTLALVDVYKKSDFGNQFESEMFNIFRELISSASIKLWLEWDDDKYLPTNQQNTEQLFSWLSVIEDEKDKIIKQGDDIRILSAIINDPVALSFMEQERSITKAYSISTVASNERYKNILKIIELQVDEAKMLTKHSDKEDKEKIFKIKQELEGILVSMGEAGKITNVGTNAKTIYNIKSKQLKELTLEGYKRFKPGLAIGPFNRINIFAGSNNVGKTSLLEAIYLLCHLNDYEGLYEMYKRRGKFIGGLPSEWLERVMPVGFSVSGVFDDYPCSVSFTKKQETDEDMDKSNYLTTIFVNAAFRENDYDARIRIKSGSSKFESFYKETYRLCNVVMSNPFTLLDRTTLEFYHNIALEKGAKDEIISFMQKYVDANIQDIEKGGTGEDFRFLVSYKNAERPIDLTEFGDGIQRVYQISLMVVAAENGVICIDEIENAIHHGLLVEFTDFVQRIANKYNVQVFATTHSAECIKAFFENDYNNEEITGFRLVQKAEGIEFQKAIGKKLQIQIEQFSLDLRG